MRALIPLLCLLLTPLHGAEKKNSKSAKAPQEPPPPPAHILLVNAVEDRGLSFLMLDGQDVQPRGFKNGQATGWFGLEAGKHQVEVEHQPLGLITKQVEFKSNSHHALIVHNHAEPQKEKRRPPRPTIGVYWMECATPKVASDNKVAVTLLNATSQPELVLQAGTLKLKARRLEPLKARLVANGSFLSLTLADPPIAEAAEGQATPPLTSINVEEKNAFYIVLHEKAPGEVGAVTFSLAPPSEAAE